METIIKSDIFFFIASLSVILLTVFWLVLISIVSYFSYRILKNIQSISSLINQQVKQTAEDVSRVRGRISEIKSIALIFLEFFSNILTKTVKKGRKKDKKKSNGKETKN